LLNRTDAWETVTFDNEKLAPRGFAQPARAW
jgi:UDP-3-O-[3-hydroxymyristoyl] N-acetylglucosamine deacetylase